MRNLLTVACVLLLAGAAFGDVTTVDIEDVPIAADSAWFGPFSSRGASFNNYYDFTYGLYWEGFSASSKTDTTASGTAGQFNAIPGSGADGSSNYAVSYVGWTLTPTVAFAEEVDVNSIAITNNNYAYYSMLNGDSFAKKFGGTSGDDADWFLLTITGKDASDATTGTVEFYLADYRFTDNDDDYIVDEWTTVDIGSLGEVKSLEFALSSSDVGAWGMNTPAYFAMDNLVYEVPEPATMILLVSGGLVMLKRKRK